MKSRTTATRSPQRDFTQGLERSPNLAQPNYSDAHAPLLKLHRLIGNWAFSQQLQLNSESSLLTGNILQRKCATCEQTSLLETPCLDCEKQQKLQRRAANPVIPATIPVAVQRVVQSPGQPLDLTTRRLMETCFSQNLREKNGLAPVPLMAPKTNFSQPGDASEQQADRVADSVLREPSSSAFPTSYSTYDFSQVRIYSDRHAADSARAVNALAYTVGSNIVFGAGQYAPSTRKGQHLLAHELTHVLQQQHSSTASGTVQRQTGSGTPPPATGLSDDMLRQIARQLREAMAGLGTDEEAIYSALSGRTQDQVEAIARTYQEMYKRDLTADLQDELNDSELQQLGAFSPIAAIPSGSTAPSATALADRVAAQLNKAMQGLGTDEESIYAALTGRTEAERQAIKAAYRRLTNRELEADLRDEMSGSELTQALRLLNQGMLQPEDELYLAMAGLGTDEDTLFRVLNSLAGNNTAIETMESNYRNKYGDLIADLRSDLSGREYARAMKVLRPVLQDVAFEDCGRTIIPEVRAIIPVGIQKVEKAISVLSRGWAGMSPVQKAEFNHFFDPSGSGVDERFIQDVLSNYRKIRREFDNDLTVECETSAGMCTGIRLYYTYWGNIHVCPYFTTETDTVRKQRDFVHELTHNALMAVDRPYYLSHRTEYDKMTPRGPWTAQIPVVGHLFRLISRSDTLYSPDAYAFFAFQVP